MPCGKKYTLFPCDLSSIFFFYRIIDELSKIYLFFTKALELFLVIAFISFINGTETLSIAFLGAGIFVAVTIGFLSYTIERMVDAEELIRTAYYDLDWLKSTISLRKLILQAMVKPAEISFGALFGYDKVSLERFGVLLKDAYDIALIFIKLAKT